MNQSEQLAYLQKQLKDKPLIDIIELAFKLYPDMSLTKEAFEELKSIKDSVEEK